MPPKNIYRIARKAQPVGIGAAGSFHVDLMAVAKANSTQVPYCVANEYICARLGRFLGLPIPPAELTSQSDTGEVWFSSLNFNFSGSDSLPPADVDVCVVQIPRESAGLLIFDVLVANPDRHRNNLSLDQNQGMAQVLTVWDHSHALLGIVEGSACNRFQQMQVNNQLEIGNHCLIGKLRTNDDFPYWCGRVSAIPDFFIDDICDQAGPNGLNNNEIVGVKGFLKHRRDRIVDILNANIHHFTGIVQWKPL